MKKLFFTVAVTAIAIITFAQTNYKPITYSLGIHGALPTGDLSTISGFGYGLSVQGEYRTTSFISLTGSLGFLNFAGKTITLNNTSLSYSSTTQVPVLVGAKLYFADRLFATGQLGLSFFNNGIGTAFTFAPGIGTRLGSGNFDATLRYLAASKGGGSYSSLDLRLAYNF